MSISELKTAHLDQNAERLAPEQGHPNRAAHHLLLAEQAAVRIDALDPGTKGRVVAHLGVIGAGTMGAGIAVAALKAGLPVTLLDLDADALARGVGRVEAILDGDVAKQRIGPEARAAFGAALAATSDFGRLGGCDAVIEAAFEDLAVKRDIFGRLGGILPDGALLATNTSYLDVDAIAAASRAPSNVVGLHFFSPAHIMKLVEVVRGAQSAPEALMTAFDLALRLGKLPVLAGNCRGFIGNRMLVPRREQAHALLLEGASPEQIDRVHTAFGMPMGPFQMSDLAGLDIGWHRDPGRIETVKDALCAEGRFGQKSGAGFYDYDERRRPMPSPVTVRIVEAMRIGRGITPRRISDDEIMVRTLYTLVNEGALILAEGMAQRASDIDVVWTSGFGWPRETGGPMFWAGTIGWDAIARALESHRDRLGPAFVLAAPLS